MSEDEGLKNGKASFCYRSLKLNTKKQAGQSREPGAGAARVRDHAARPRRRLRPKTGRRATDIENACMELTMDILRKLEPISDKVRYMMMISSMSPIKCLCVGISPYENGILPTFASAMAFSQLDLHRLHALGLGHEPGHVAGRAQHQEDSCTGA